MKLAPAVFAFGCWAALGAAFAADGTLDAAKSTLAAEFTQLGVPVSAPFKTFGGSIAYDAAKPADANAHLDIEPASLDIGDDYNAELRKKEWFDSAQFPRASFDARGLKALGGGRFAASGTLMLKGRAKPLTVPMTITATAAATNFDGVLTISRKDFGIGDPAWDDVLEDGVKIKFHLIVPAAR